MIIKEMRIFRHFAFLLLCRWKGGFCLSSGRGVFVNLNDYINGLVIGVKVEENAAVVKSITNSDIFTVDVVGNVMPADL